MLCGSGFEVLADIARNDCSDYVCTLAIGRITDEKVLEEIIDKRPEKDVRWKALYRLKQLQGS